MVALSGGVDSAVAARLLQQRGYDVQCLHMTNWDDEDAYCSAAQEFRDAKAVCEHLGVPLHRANFAREYRDEVFADFLSELERGRTPNPDVLCNRAIKFGVLAQYVRRLGARWLATGHYARLGRADGQAVLLKGKDKGKDQSYFLHAVSASDFDDVLFPLGELTKDEVRRIARETQLPVAEKKDSTGLCFIGERPFAKFVSRFLTPEPGTIKTADGELLGQHVGLAFYTLGQRHGLAIGGRKGHSDAPWYVAAKDSASNELIVVQGHDHPLLLSDSVIADEAHWIGPLPTALATGNPLACTAKTRYRQPDQPCRVRLVGKGRLELRFDEPQRAVTPGQYAVLYCGDRCLGGAMIIAAQRAESAAAASV
jgi:tRNA-specific 2-thiouridylase